MNRLGSITCQNAKVMHFAGTAGLYYQTRDRSKAFANQMLMNR
jgi:hypothetical protein